MPSSASKKRRTREKEDVRQKIMDAARELFVTQGYEAVTMRQIAQKIEYTPTAIYFHFKDKQALINECCATDFLSLAKAFAHLAELKNPAQRLRLMAVAYLEFGLKHPNHYRLLFMTPHPHQQPDENRIIRQGDPAQDAYAFLRATVIECIAGGYFKKQYRDPELVSQLLWSCVHGVVSLHIARAHDPWIIWRPVRLLGEAMLNVSLDGIMNDSSQAAPPPSGKKGKR